MLMLMIMSEKEASQLEFIPNNIPLTDTITHIKQYVKNTMEFSLE